MQRKITAPAVLLVGLTLSLVMFALINRLTISPQRISGNGNLAIPIIWLAVPVFVFSLRSVVKVSRGYFRRKKFPSAELAVILLSIALCAWGVYRQIHSLLGLLHGGPDNQDSVIYRYGWLNQYTNKLFFNAYTFAVGVLMALLCAWLAECLRKRD